MSGGMASLPLVAALALVAFLGCHQATTAAGIDVAAPQLAPAEAASGGKGANTTAVDGSSDQKTPRLLDTSTHVEIINDNSQLNKNSEEPKAEPEPDNPISGGQEDQEAIQENPSDQDPLADDYSSDTNGSKDSSVNGEEDYIDEAAEEGGETSQNSRTRTRGGASSRRTLSTLMRKRAQQQRGGNREQAAERAHAYYERHGIHVLTEQKEETKPGTKRYKLRNKPPPSRLQERRRQQQERNKERQEQKEQYEQLQADRLDDAVEETPTVDQTPESKPDESGSSPTSQSLSRREQLSQKRKLKKQQQEQQRKQQLEEEHQQIEEKEQVEKEIIQPVLESLVQIEEQEAQNDTEPIIEEQSNQPKTVTDVVPEIKADKQADDLTKLTQQEKIEQEKHSEDEARKKRLEIRKRLMLMRQKQQQDGEDLTATDQATQTVLEQILSLRQPDNQKEMESVGEIEGIFSDETEEIRKVHQQVLLEQLKQLNKQMQVELAASAAATDDVIASVVQSSQTPQREETSLPSTFITESTNDTAEVPANAPKPEIKSDTDSAPAEDLGIADEEIVDSEPEPKNQPGTESAPEDLGIAADEIVVDVPEPETQPGTDSEPAEDLEKSVDEIVANVGVESAAESAQKTEPSATEGEASEGDDKISESFRRPDYKRPTFKRPFFKRPTLSTPDTGDSKTEGVLQGTTRRTVPPPRGRPSLFRRNNTKQTTIGTPKPETVSEGTPSTPTSGQLRPLPFGIANQMRIKRPTLFRDRQREETISTEPTVAQEVNSSTAGQAEAVLNRANSKFKDPEFVERPQVFHIRKPSFDEEESLVDAQNLHNLTLDEVSELYPANPHLQYIEDDPDEIFQFEDTILEEVTLDYLENVSEGPFIGTTIDVTAQETQGVNEIPIVETKGPMTWTTIMLNFEDATTVPPNDEEVTDIVTEQFITSYDHEPTLKNEKETPEIVETTEKIPIDSIQESTTLRNTEPTEFETSIFTNQETISDTEDQVVTTTQISPELIIDSEKITTKKSYTFTARPFRYSLYNKRPGSKLQEIMSRRTAPTSSPTATISAETETLTPTVTESVHESDPETIKSSSTVDKTSQTESYETSDVDVTEPTTESSDDRLGAQIDLKQSNKLSTPGVPVAASTLVTVTTSPVIYVDHSPQGDEDQNKNIGTSTEKPILNIADAIERMNIFHGSVGATTNQDVTGTDVVNDYAILGAIKNVISESGNPLTTSSSIAETGITDIANEINPNKSIPAAVDKGVPQDDAIYSDEPTHHEDYYEYYNSDSDNVTDANFVYATDYDHTNESAIDYNATIVSPADDINYDDARNYDIDVTKDHNNTDYYDSDITGNHNNSESYDYYYDYVDTENSTGVPETTEIVLTESEPQLADPQDLSEISDMPEGVAILTDGFFYPNQPVIEEKTLEENTPLDESQLDLKVTDQTSNQHADSESSSPTHSSSFAPEEEVKVSTGFLIKDTPYKNTEKLYGATDIEANQVRTDRKNTLNSQETTQLQEMMIQNENDPSAPPVKLLVSNNFGRISAGDQDTFDISVSSSLFTGGDSKPKQHIRVGQVIPVAVDQGNALNSAAEERQEARQAGEDGPLVDNIEKQPAENEGELGVGVGQVIPVDLTEEEKLTEIEDGTNDVPPPPPQPPTSAPSFLGTLFNMFTRPERPRPRPRPNRPDRPRPQPPRRFPNGTEIDAEDMATFSDHPGNRPMRPTIFRPPRPNHPYRPFRPTGFRPPRPDLQPPLELEGAIGADNDGVSFDDSPVLHSAIRPNMEFENRPLFEPNPDDSSTPQLVDRSRPPFAGARPNKLPFRPPSLFRPTSPLRPPPPPAFSMPNEKIENEQETDEPTTLLPPVLSDSDSAGTLHVEQTDTLPGTEIEDVVKEESLDIKADLHTYVEVKTMLPSDITTERIPNIPSVIEIKGPLEDFINQLIDGPEMGESASLPEKTVENLRTETTSSTTTTTEQPAVTESQISIETAGSIIEKELSTNVSKDDINELEITSPDNIYKSESATESLTMVREVSLPIETDSMIELEISTDVPIIVDQSVNTLQPDFNTEIKLEPSTHTMTTTTALEASSGNSTVVTNQSTTSSIEEEATPTIPLVEATASSITEFFTESSTTTTTTTTTLLSTSPVDNIINGDADKYYDNEFSGAAEEESQPRDETINLDVEETYLQDNLYDPLESYDNFVASDTEEDYQNSSTGSLPSTLSSTSVTPLEKTQTSSSIQDERYESHGVATEKTTPHPYHNIPDGSFVSTSHLYSDSPDFSARIPRPRPTVVLPGSRPGPPIVRRPTDFPKRPHFERPRPVNQEVVPNAYQGPPPRPFIETGFQGLREEERPVVDENVREEITIETEKGPTLPPSLPNLQIIPFVAADAVKKADDNLAVESAPDDVREVILPPDFLPGTPIAGQHELCWENGRILGNGVPVNYTKDACQSCRCYFGQLICQTQECQDVPAHCQGVMQPGECCPMIVCEHEIKEGETIPHNIDAVSVPNENEYINPAGSDDYPDGSIDYAREPSDYTEEGNEKYLVRENQDDYSQDVDQDVQPIKSEMTTPSSSDLVHPASRRPPIADRLPESNKPMGGPGTEDRRPLIPNRFADSDKRPSPPFRNTPPVDRSDIPPLRRKPSVGGSRPTLPFILRNRPGGRPSFIPPRKPSFFQSTTTRFPSSTTERNQEEVLHDDDRVQHGDETVPHDDERVPHEDERVPHGDERVPHGDERVPHGDEIVLHGDERVPEIELVQFTSSTTTTTTEIQPLVVPGMSTTSKPFLSDLASFLAKVGAGDETQPNFLLPKPIQQTTALESAEIENLLLREDFQFGQDPQPSGKPVKQPVKPILPDIPDSVKSQLPLGIDAIMASGMFQLSGCNIYGREYKVGDGIKELSAACKACRCTPVGVQCLPIC